MAKGNQAAQGNGVEVARITVKVSPDSRLFRRELKEQLDRIEKEYAAGDKAKVGVGADTKRVKADIKKAGKGLKAEVEIATKSGSMDRFQRRTTAELQSGMNRLEAKINLDQSGESFRRDIEKAAGKLDKVIKSPIPDDISGAASRRAAIREELDALKQLGEMDKNTIAPKLDAEADFRLRKRLATLDQQIADERRKQQLTDWKTELQHMKMREDETRKFMDIYRRENPPLKLKLDPQFDFKLRQKLSRIKPKVDVVPEVRESVMAGFAKSLTGKLSKLTPSFGSGVNLGGYAVLAGLIAFLAGPLVGLLTTTLLAIPGMLAGILTPIAAITLGLDGMKRAAGVLKTPFEELKTTMSSVNEKAFTPVFEKLKGIFPTLKESMPQVSDGLASIAQSIADTVTAPENLDKLKNTFTNIGTALRTAAPGIGDFTSGILTLVEQFTAKMPAISEWLNGAGRDFKNWVEGMVKDGSLSTAFDGLGETIRLILEGLGKIATEGMNFMKDPANLENFKNALKGIADLLTTIVNISGKIPDIVENWGFSKDSTAYKKLQDRMKGDANKGSGESTLPAWLDPEGWANDLKNWWRGNTEKGVEFAKLSADEQKQAFKDSFAKSEDMFGGSGSFGAPDISTDQQKEMILNAFKGGNVSGVTDTLKQELTNGLNQATGEATAVLSQGMQQLSSQFQIDLMQIANTSTAQINAALAPLQQAPALVMTAFQGLGAAITGSWATVVSTMASGGQQMLAAASAAFANLPGAASSALAGVQSTVQGSLNGVLQVFVTTGNTIVAEVQGWAGKIQGALAGLSGIGNAAGSALGSGLLAGMQSQEGAIIAYASSLADKIAAVKGPLPYDRKVLQPNGEALMQGLGKGMENGFQPVLEQAKGLAAQIADAFASGGDPTTMLTGFQKSEVNRMEKVLKLESQKLANQAKSLDYQAKSTGNDSLKAQAQAIRDKQTELDMQREMLDLAGDYNDTVGNSDNPLAKAASGLMAAPVNFAKATGQQFLSDIGISGNGLISKAITEGIQYVFNISSVDEAMALKDRQEANQALTVTGR